MKTIDQVEVGNVIQKGKRIATVSEVIKNPSSGEILEIKSHFGIGNPLSITSDFADWTIVRESW